MPRIVVHAVSDLATALPSGVSQATRRSLAYAVGRAVERGDSSWAIGIGEDGGSFTLVYERPASPPAPPPPPPDPNDPQAAPEGVTEDKVAAFRRAQSAALAPVMTPAPSVVVAAMNAGLDAHLATMRTPAFKAAYVAVKANSEKRAPEIAAAHEALET